MALGSRPGLLTQVFRYPPAVHRFCPTWKNPPDSRTMRLRNSQRREKAPREHAREEEISQLEAPSDLEIAHPALTSLRCGYPSKICCGKSKSSSARSQVLFLTVLKMGRVARGGTQAIAHTRRSQSYESDFCQMSQRCKTYNYVILKGKIQTDSIFTKDQSC